MNNAGKEAAPLCEYRSFGFSDQGQTSTVPHAFKRAWFASTINICCDFGSQIL